MVSNYLAACVSRPPGSLWQRRSGDLTWPPSLDVAVVVSAATFGLSFSSLLSVLFGECTGAGEGRNVAVIRRRRDTHTGPPEME